MRHPAHARVPDRMFNCSQKKQKKKKERARKRNVSELCRSNRFSSVIVIETKLATVHLKIDYPTPCSTNLFHLNVSGSHTPRTVAPGRRHWDVLMLSIPLRIIGQACGLHLHQQVNASAITAALILGAWHKKRHTHLVQK